MSSSLIVEVCEIKDIKKHPNADSLEIAIVKGWECIVPINKYKAGDVIIYIPIDAILPTELADRLNVRNYLAGINKNRVRCAKLRQEMSYGIIMDNEGNWDIGTDVAEHYGITKYEPPIRTQNGDEAPDDPTFMKFTDIENIKNFPNVFEEGDEVIVTEKIDGSNDRIGFFKDPEDGSTEWKAGSHSLKRKMPNPDYMETNVYWYPYTLPSVLNLLNHLNHDDTIKRATVYGEIYGKVRGGVKSMDYGRPNSLNYVAFSMEINGKYVNWDVFYDYCSKFNVPMAPLIWRGQFNIDHVKTLCTGKSLLAEINGADHMREGIVIVSSQEKFDSNIGRSILKMLNPDYILLKEKSYSKGEIADYTDI